MGSLIAASSEKDGLLPFTDREKELDFLKSLVEEAISGRGNLVFVAGEAGIGKTRLVHELMSYAANKGMRCLKSKCYRQSEAGTLYPYSAFIQFIRQFSDEASIQLFYRVCGTNVNQIIRLVPELARNHPPDSSSTSIEQPLSPEVVQKEEIRLLQSVTEFFFGLSKESPLLLFVDDWQWCGHSSFKLLQFMRSSNLIQYPILIVCAYRDTEVQDLGEDVRPWVFDFLANLERERSFNVVRLKRFDLDNVAELLKSAFSKDGIGQEFLNLIYSKTGGNPFFVEEVLKALVEDGKIFRDSEGKWQRKEISEIVIPQTISTVIKHRLDRLGAETLNTLSAASVLGEGFDLEILNKVLPDITMEKLRDQLERVLKSGLILERARSSSPTDSHYSFSDESVRDVLYEQIDSGLRTKYHRLIALALEESFRNRGNDLINEHASELAHHFLRCGNKAKSLEYYVIAGTKASRLYAHQLACRNFHSALELAYQLGESGKNSNQEEKYNPLIRAELLDALGSEAQFVPSEFQNVVNYWEESASIYEKIGERRKAADVLTRLGIIYYLVMFDLAKSGESNTKALLLLEGDESGGSELARAYVWGMIEDVWRGDRETVLAKSRKAVEIGEKVRAYDAIVMANTLPSALSTLDEFESAMESNNYGIKLALDHDLFLEGSLCYFHRAVVNVNTKGASKQALEFFLEALDYSSKTGEFMVSLFNKVELAYDVYLPLGEWKNAEELAEDVRRSVVGLPPSSLFVILADSVSGQVLLCKGELERAEECLRRVESKTKGFGILQIDVPLYMSLARLYMNKGEYENASSYLSEGYRRSKKRGLVILNCVPHVQLLSHMIEFALIRRSEREDMNDQNLDSLFSELSETCKKINEEWAFAYLHRSQGLIEYHNKEYGHAESSLQTSIDTWKELGWRFELGRSLFFLGDAYRVQGKINRGAEIYRESLRIFEELGAKFEIEKVKKLIEECDLTMKSGILSDPSTAVLSDEKSRVVFDYLVKTFIQDLIVNKIPIDKCGWRSLRMIEKEAKVPASVLYARTGGVGPTLKQLLQSKLVESAIFSGQRGRGGEVTRVRLAYLTNSIAKEYVDREFRNKSPALNRG